MPFAGIRSVDVITHHRMPAIEQMDADLMGATRDRKRLDQTRLSIRFQYPEGRFAILTFLVVDAHAADLLWVRFQLGGAGPFRLLGHAVDDDHVGLVHFSGFEKVTVSVHSTKALGEEQNAAGIAIQSMDMAEEFQVARAGPEMPGGYAGGDGRLEIALGALPGEGHEQPTRRLVDSHDGAILIQDGDAGDVPAFAEFHALRFCHGGQDSC